MLGRKRYSRREIDRARLALGTQLAAYTRLVDVASTQRMRAALEVFEPQFFNGLLLTVDRCFVHRARAVTGKGVTPLNEVELICESLMNNGGVLRGNRVIAYLPELAILGLAIGERIQLSAQQFERLSAAFFAELEEKFAEEPTLQAVAV